MLPLRIASNTMSILVAFAFTQSLFVAPAPFLSPVVAVVAPPVMVAPAVARPFVTRVAVATSAAFATAVVVPVTNAVQRKLSR